MSRSIAEIYRNDTSCHDLLHMRLFGKKRVYLDYAAATPLSKEVFLAMKPFLTEFYGNASAIHSEGLLARKAVEAARERSARALQVRPEQVTFVGSGTESNNLAIIGSVEALLSEGRKLSDIEVVTTNIEHPSVMETMKALEKRGIRVRYVEVDSEGFVKPDSLRTLLTEKTVLFSVAYANSEIGVVQKLHALKKVLSEAEKRFGTKIFFHVDAAQAPLWLSCQLESVFADLLSLDAGKCNGPKGVGLLVKSRRAKIVATIFGGGQEVGLRPGTENTAGIVGASVALEIAQRNFKERAERVSKIRDAGIIHILSKISGSVLNGPIGEVRLANNINISVPGLDTEFATIVLDKHGFAVSTKSACAGAGGGESTVVSTISNDPARSKSTLRMSLSPQTSLEDLKRLTALLTSHIEKMKRFD
jgi:cysteine desulfurase